MDQLAALHLWSGRAAWIGWQHEHEHRPLVEIWRELNQRGIVVNDLYGVPSETPVAAVTLDHPTADELADWRRPYQAPPFPMLATFGWGRGHAENVCPPAYRSPGIPFKKSLPMLSQRL